MTRIVGVDVGGTKIAVGLVDIATGRVGDIMTMSTQAAGEPDEILARCVSLATKVGAGRRCAAVGLGVCELVDPDGRITSANSFDWRGLDVAGAFAGIAPCHVESDMRAAALAEAGIGAGVGMESFLYAGIGTGAACALVADGVVRVGARGNAMFLGTPALEGRSGGAALNGRFGPDLDAAMKDPVASEAIAAAAADVGEAIGIVVNAVDPHLVIVGGGLGTNERYFDALVDSVRATIYAEDTARLPIVRSTLGNRGGVIGAALAAAKALRL